MKPDRHINEGSAKGFGELLVSVQSGDKEAYQNLIFVSIEIVKTWCRHRKTEPEWLAEKDRIIRLDEIITSLTNRYVDTHNGDCQATFAGYRDYLTSEAGKIIESGFAGFLAMLRMEDNRAWKLVFSSLEKKAALWFHKRSQPAGSDQHSIFCESVELVYQNLSSKDLIFRDSSEFKSYFFRVLENKYLEAGRDSFSRRSQPIEEARHSSFLVQHPADLAEEDENRMVLTKALGVLNPEEKHILTEHYFCERRLNEIAAEMKLSEGNIRIRKFRALQKLSDYLNRMGYGAQRG